MRVAKGRPGKNSVAISAFSRLRPSAFMCCALLLDLSGFGTRISSFSLNLVRRRYSGSLALALIVVQEVRMCGAGEALQHAAFACEKNPRCFDAIYTCKSCCSPGGLSENGLNCF